MVPTVSGFQVMSQLHAAVDSFQHTAWTPSMPSDMSYDDLPNHVEWKLHTTLTQNVGGSRVLFDWHDYSVHTLLWQAAEKFVLFYAPLASCDHITLQDHYSSRDTQSYFLVRLETRLYSVSSIPMPTIPDSIIELQSQPYMMWTTWNYISSAHSFIIQEQ